MKKARECDERLKLTQDVEVSFNAADAECKPREEDSWAAALIRCRSVVWEVFNARGHRKAAWVSECSLWPSFF
jgi:hypothetical protein